MACKLMPVEVRAVYMCVFLGTACKRMICNVQVQTEGRCNGRCNLCCKCVMLSLAAAYAVIQLATHLASYISSIIMTSMSFSYAVKDSPLYAALLGALLNVYTDC